VDQPLLHPRSQPKKSFIRWAVEQGLTVFMISWKSADETLVGIGFDDYLKAQIEILDTVRDLLGVENAHLIGYCVAGTYLAATLALLEARGRATRSPAPPSSPPRSISARRATSASSWATSRWG
jgi:poly(3-hydroxyalkanoate) synthetase